MPLNLSMVGSAVSKLITISQKPGNWAEAGHALLNGGAEAMVRVMPEWEWEFHFEPNGCRNAKRGLFAIADPYRLGAALLAHAGSRTPFALAPGLLVDEGGLKFLVVMDEIHREPDGTFIGHRLDEFGNPIEVSFPVACFLIRKVQAPAIAPTRQAYDSQTSFARIFRDFSQAYPSGGTKEFKVWVEHQPTLSVAVHGGKPRIELSHGVEPKPLKYWSMKSLYNEISKRTDPAPL
jgi:hypothetical protein